MACRSVRPRTPLEAWLWRKNMTQLELGQKICVDQAQISKWVRGVICPRVPTRLKIEKVTRGGVSIRDWKDVPRKKKAA